MIFTNFMSTVKCHGELVTCDDLTIVPKFLRIASNSSDQHKILLHNFRYIGFFTVEYNGELVTCDELRKSELVTCDEFTV